MKTKHWWAYSITAQQITLFRCSTLINAIETKDRLKLSQVRTVGYLRKKLTAEQAQQAFEEKPC